jgi:hypothetical protein
VNFPSKLRRLSAQFPLECLIIALAAILVRLVAVEGVPARLALIERSYAFGAVMPSINRGRHFAQGETIFDFFHKHKRFLGAAY